MVYRHSLRTAVLGLLCSIAIACGDTTQPTHDPLADLEGTWIHIQDVEDLSRRYVAAVTIRADGSADDLGVEQGTGRLTVLYENAYSLTVVGDGQLEVRSFNLIGGSPAPARTPYLLHEGRLSVEESVGPFRSMAEYHRVTPDERVLEPVHTEFNAVIRFLRGEEDGLDDLTFQSNAVSKIVPAIAIESSQASPEDGWLLDVSAYSTGMYLRFVLGDVRGPGTYDGGEGTVSASMTRIGGDDLMQWQASGAGAPVTVVITDYDRGGGRCTGTFTALLAPPSEFAPVIEVRSGEFDVPLLVRSEAP